MLPALRSLPCDSADPRSIVHPPFDCRSRRSRVGQTRPERRSSTRAVQHRPRVGQDGIHDGSQRVGASAKDRLRWTRAMNRKGFVSEGQLAAEQDTLRSESGLGVRSPRTDWGLRDDRRGDQNIPKEDDERRARLTLRSRVDGTSHPDRRGSREIVTLRRAHGHRTHRPREASRAMNPNDRIRSWIARRPRSHSC